MDYAPENTVARIIRLALMDVGFLQEGTLPNSRQYADGISRLNDIINFEQTQGLKVWLQSDIEVTLVAGQNRYRFEPGSTDVDMKRPMQVLQAYYLNADQIRRPLVNLSWEEWLRLSQVNQTGEINSYFVDKQATFLDVYFWLTPDANAATGTAHVLVRRQVDNVSNLSEETTFPPEWGIFLRWALADDWSSGQPQAIVQKCQQKCETYRAALENFDVEDSSTRFTPDQRAMYGYGEFN